MYLRFAPNAELSICMFKSQTKPMQTAKWLLHGANGVEFTSIASTAWYQGKKYCMRGKNIPWVNQGKWRIKMYIYTQHYTQPELPDAIFSLFSTISHSLYGIYKKSYKHASKIVSLGTYSISTEPELNASLYRWNCRPTRLISFRNNWEMSLTCSFLRITIILDINA